MNNTEYPIPELQIDVFIKKIKNILLSGSFASIIITKNSDVCS